ncbi:NHL repeat-containing protein [Candidatus Micrarchaeota archaeon]|nr:NHL repeat-containing protein [Candidatus Micrarchaeota archaeon]
MKKYVPFLVAFAFLFAFSFADFEFLREIDGTGEAHSNTVNNFTAPAGLAFYNGHLYVSDQDNRFIYELSNNTVTYRAGGSNILGGPRNIAIDVQGTIYVADYGGASVRKILGSTQMQRLGLSGEFSSAVSLYSEGSTLYVLDSSNPRISAFSLGSGVTNYSTTFAQAGDSSLSVPSDMWIYEGNFYVADTGNNRIAVFDSNFSFLQSIGKGKGGVSLRQPKGVFVSDKMVFVSDTLNNRVAVFSMDGYPLETLYGGNATGGRNFSQPTDLIVHEGVLYVADAGNKRVVAYSIGEIGGNATVLAQISEANASVARLQKLLSVAQRLGVPATSSAEGLLSASVSSYENFRYSDAADQARSAKDAADSQYPALVQQIIVKLRQLSSAANSTMSQYAEISTPAYLLANRTAILSKITQVENAIGAGNYSLAADIALELPSLASSFALQAQAGATNNTQAQAQPYLDSIVSARSWLGALSTKAAANGLPFDGAQVSSLLDMAQTQALSGNFAQANATISQAHAQLEALAYSIEQSIQQSNPALVAIANAQAKIAALEAERLIFYPNMQPSRTLLSQASSLASSEPQRAIELAQQAQEAAIGEASNARSLSYVAIAVGGVALIMVLVAAGMIWYLHSKRKRRRL